MQLMSYLNGNIYRLIGQPVGDREIPESPHRVPRVVTINWTAAAAVVCAGKPLLVQIRRCLSGTYK